MTIADFQVEMAKLDEAFPKQFSSKTRVKLIYEVVKDLDRRWFEKLVNRAIIANDSRFNFDEAARCERQRLKSLELAENVVGASKAMSAHISENGLGDALRLLNANSLLEAILPRRNTKDRNLT